ncbi:restriction endonuclease [bacterium]|nr:restriction endonuclease [bacterium]
MKAGYLSEYFDGVGVKRLTLVEVDPDASHQHEFQGVNDLKQILGQTSEKKILSTTFLRLSDENGVESIESFTTWSNVRRAKPDRSPEYHLYYSAEADPLVYQCTPGDLLIVALKPNGSLAVLLIEQHSTYERQLLWLFGVSEDLQDINIQEFGDDKNRELHFAAKYILDELGIEIDIANENWLDRILAEIGDAFPSTSDFSRFARTSLAGEISVDNPDFALIVFIEQEEMLFRTLERYIVSKRIHEGFNDVDDFIDYSLSVQNRRKSRAGFALENHLEFIFRKLNVRYSRGAITENRARPDFLFPGIDYYRNNQFHEFNLTMLGVKSTCKDRWRQVLSEAERIKEKHLLTLEPAISLNQTDEMKANDLRLVIPAGLHDTYREPQREWLLSLGEFIEIIKDKQQKIM